MPLVSVIIPTYGHRDYVLATLDSVFEQTFTDYEIIVINDGSPDDTAAVLKPLADAGRIRYFDQPNAGQSAARNRGLSMATGEFVALLDDDDLWPPDKLAWQVDMLRDSDAVAVGGNCALLKDGRLDTVTEPHTRPRLVPADFFTHNAFFSPGQVLIRRSALDAVGGFDASLWGTDDLDLWMRLSAHGEMRYVSRVALHYRVHSGNASRHWERMLLNGRKTHRKNLGLLPPDERKRAAAAGELFNYFCTGSPQVQAAWSLRPARWRAAAKAVGLFLRPALTQPRLAVALARDLVPVRLRRLLRPKH